MKKRRYLLNLRGDSETYWCECKGYAHFWRLKKTRKCLTYYNQVML